VKSMFNNWTKRFIKSCFSEHLRKQKSQSLQTGFSIVDRIIEIWNLKLRFIGVIGNGIEYRFQWRKYIYSMALQWKNNDVSLTHLFD
jgi:hypothetical protein